MTPQQVYWIAKLDDIRYIFDKGVLDGMSLLFLIIAILTTIALTVALIATEPPEDMRRSLTKVRRFSVILAVLTICMQLLCGLATAFIPTTKQATAIMIIPKIANSETVKDLGDVGSEFVVLAKEWLAELHPKKK